MANNNNNIKKWEWYTPKDDAKYIISYSNELNDFPLDRHSAKAYDLFWVFIGKMHNQGTNVVTLQGAELRRAIKFRGTKKAFNDMTFKLANKLLDTRFQKRMENGDFELIQLFETARYKAEDESMTLKATKPASEFFTNLTSNFTSWYQKTLIDLDTVYSKTLFRKLSQFSSTGKYFASIQDFRDYMGTPKSYSKRDFIAKAVKPSLLRLMPYFKNLKMDYQKASSDQKIIVGVIITFDKFDSSKALVKGLDNDQCISNIRLNPYFSDDEKCEAEDIFLKQKSGTAKKAMEQRKASGLGPLDEVIESPKKNKNKEVGEQQPTQQAPETRENDTDKAFVDDNAQVQSQTAVTANGIPEWFDKLMDYTQPTLPQDISLKEGLLQGAPDDPLVYEWLASNFPNVDLNINRSLEKKVNSVMSLNLSEDKKQSLVTDLVLGKEWSSADKKIVPYDPLLRTIWADIQSSSNRTIWADIQSSSNIRLLAGVYKLYYFNTGERLTKMQKHDEALLKTLANKFDRTYAYLNENYDADTLAVIASLRNWDRLKGWNDDAPTISMNLPKLTLNSLNIPVNNWLNGKPNLEI